MSAIDQISGQQISPKCPNIGIKKLTISSSQIEIKGDPFHMCSFSPEEEFVACDYDQPINKLTQIIRGRTRGPIQYGGHQCIEFIEDQLKPDGTPILRSRRILHVGNHFTRTLLTLSKRIDGSGVIEPVHLETPVKIANRLRWKVWETEADANESQIYYQSVDGLYNVSIGKQSEQCLRWTRLRTKPPHPFDEAEEVFISIHTGLTILLQHYIGKGWHHLDKLRKCPKIEVKGRIFHLWFIRRVLRSV